MRLSLTWWWMVIVCGGQLTARAQLQLLSTPAPQQLFAGAVSNVSVTFSNSGNGDFDEAIRLRVFQASSSTAAPLGERPWRRLEVLPRQTVLESAAVDFPAVNAETKFLVQWLAGKNDVIGETEVLAYPSNLLHELKVMFAPDELGLLDPNNRLKPLFIQNQVKFLDLEKAILDDFTGKLAIIGPFESKGQLREGLAKGIQRIAMKGVAVIWIQPPPVPGDNVRPSFYVVSEIKGAVVVVQPGMIADFSQNPASQLNLVRFCKLAVNPKPFGLPDFACSHE